MICRFKEKAVDGTMWRARFRGAYGLNRERERERERERLCLKNDVTLTQLLDPGSIFYPGTLQAVL